MSYLYKTPEDLLPCPHCGGEARFETYGGTACAVVCQSCHCGTPTMSLVDGTAAVNRWNLRAGRTCRNLNLHDDVQPIDRNALLELADEMMVTDDERREVARRLRKCTLPKNYTQAQGGGWSHLCDMALAVGLKQEDRPTAWDLVQRLAELIDPTCEVHRDALFYPATDLTSEHEETVFRCGRCEEIVSYDADYDPETDLPAYCERCGSRITGIGEPWDE